MLARRVQPAFSTKSAGGEINVCSWIDLPKGLSSGSTTSQIYSLGTDNKGIWVSGQKLGYASRSIDNGETWSALTKGLNCGSVDRSISSIATDGKGVWIAGCHVGYASRSIDNGLTWSVLPRGLSGVDWFAVYIGDLV